MTIQNLINKLNEYPEDYEVLVEEEAESVADKDYIGTTILDVKPFRGFDTVILVLSMDDKEAIEEDD